jgi:hypothetical protein
MMGIKSESENAVEKARMGHVATERDVRERGRAAGVDAPV